MDDQQQDGVSQHDESQHHEDNSDVLEQETSASDQAIDSVKRQALEALIPLVDSLEGTPEHKFEILMGAVQSSTDTALLQKALEVAKQIEDKSSQAEALVDVLREADFRQENSAASA